jgi:hypothetical protein
MTNAEYQNMAWNNTGFGGQLGENWSGALRFKTNISQILEFLKERNINIK